MTNSAKSLAPSTEYIQWVHDLEKISGLLRNSERLLKGEDSKYDPSELERVWGAAFKQMCRLAAAATKPVNEFEKESREALAAVEWFSIEEAYRGSYARRLRDAAGRKDAVEFISDQILRRCRVCNALTDFRAIAKSYSFEILVAKYPSYFTESVIEAAII